MSSTPKPCCWAASVRVAVLGEQVEQVHLGAAVPIHGVVPHHPVSIPVAGPHVKPSHHVAMMTGIEHMF